VTLPFGTMLLLIVATTLLHVVYLVFNSAAVALMRLPMPEAACVVIMASQKVGRRGPALAAAGQRPGAGCGGLEAQDNGADPAALLAAPLAAPRGPPQSAPVAVTVITYIASSSATQGLLAVPCVVGQVRRRGGRRGAAPPPAPAMPRPSRCSRTPSALPGPTSYRC
jgi:hypothetical protein